MKYANPDTMKHYDKLLLELRTELLDLKEQHIDIECEIKRLHASYFDHPDDTKFLKFWRNNHNHGDQSDVTIELDPSEVSRVNDILNHLFEVRKEDVETAMRDVMKKMQVILIGEEGD